MRREAPIQMSCLPYTCDKSKMLGCISSYLAEKMLNQPMITKARYRKTVSQSIFPMMLFLSFIVRSYMRFCLP